MIKRKKHSYSAVFNNVYFIFNFLFFVFIFFLHYYLFVCLFVCFFVFYYYFLFLIFFFFYYVIPLATLLPYYSFLYIFTHPLGSWHNMYTLKCIYVNSNVHIIMYSIDIKIHFLMMCNITISKIWTRFILQPW